MGRLLWLADELEAAGLPVVRAPGWEYRGTSSIDAWWQVFHHTASSSSSGPHGSLPILINGRSDLPGPLCNVSPGRNGVLVVVASGRANHAGDGEYPDGVTDNNGHSVGWEFENNGIGEPWPEAELANGALGMAVVERRLARPSFPGWVARVLGHKEYTPRKIDPAGVDMPAYRRRVASAQAVDWPAIIEYLDSESDPMLIIPPPGRKLGPPILVSGAGVHYVNARQAWLDNGAAKAVELPDNDIGIAEYRRWTKRVGLFERLLARRRPATS